MTPVERRILIKVLTMYCLEHMKQTEIARRLGVVKALSQSPSPMKILKTSSPQWKNVSA